MRHRRSRPVITHVLISISLTAATGLLHGCDASALLSAASGAPSSETLAVLAAGTTAPSVVTAADAGTNFADALSVQLADVGKTVVSGTLKNASDINVFVFGPVHAGEVLVADVSASSANTRAALFDQDQMLLMANDDRNYYGNQLDPRIQTTLRRDCPQMYLAIAASGQPAGFLGLGSGSPIPYQLTLTRGAGSVAPPPQPQVVWLEFGGRTAVQIAAETPVDVPAFDPGRITPDLASQRDAILDRMMQFMQADYAPFNVTLLRSGRDTRPDGPYATLYFGGFSSSYLGLADEVDYFNSDPRQKAIIYTDTLSLFASLKPTADQTAQAIANVAAHELGHLLGLEHTAGTQCLMSPAASAQAVFNIDASFIPAPLDAAVFPMGRQNCPAKLALGVGLRDPSMDVDAFLSRPKQPSPAARVQIESMGAAAMGVSLESLGVRMCNRCN